MWRSIDKPHTLDWLSLKQFKFVVGPEGQEFTVHSALVAEQSKPLHAVITNGMKESLEGIVRWPHVDVATFKRFSEYLYTGDFMSPCFGTSTDVPSDRSRKANHLGRIEDVQIIQKAYSRFQFRRRYVFQQYPSIYVPHPDWDDVYDDGDCSEVFSSVANVYIFAHYYDIQRLMTFCRAKIHSLMSLAHDREEVIDLLQLCKDQPAAAGLKELVFEYCALSLHWFLTHKWFHTILEEYPEASLRIIKKMKSFNTLYGRDRSHIGIKDPEGDSSDSEADWYRERAED
ncbi:hypothetical protein MY1884_007153 [Beauveria asiatica]